MSNSPIPITSFNDEYGIVTYTGIFQIDIYTPLGDGESEANTKYSWIHKLFAMGENLGDVSIDYCQRVKQGAERTDVYVTKARIAWSCVTDR